MSDAKYGHLFTEEDMRRMLAAIVLDHLEDRSPEVLDAWLADARDTLYRMGRLTFPADEPLFLLRAQEEIAPDLIDGAACFAENRFLASDEFFAALDEIPATMREWQAANPDRVKAPDSTREAA